MVPLTGVFLLVTTAGAVATGASFTGVTVTETVTAVVPPLPSLTVMINTSVPL
ncbi:hypothetical protein D3C85_1542420 [compost metagenome]